METDNEVMRVGDCYKLLLDSKNATTMPDNSFRFNVNLKDIDGEVVRCDVKKVVYPTQGTYIPRRLWFAYDNTFKNTYTNAQAPVNTKVNDYNNLIAKYGLYAWIYLYYPKKNMYLRIQWNITQNTNIHNTWFSTSTDGVNWSANSGASGIGLVLDVDIHGSAGIPFDCYEIDKTTLPYGTFIQNIHCPQFKMPYSLSSSTKTSTDIIGDVPMSSLYTPNDVSYRIEDNDCSNEMSGSALRALTSLDIYFSRVALLNVNEQVSMPWSLEIVFYVV